MAEKPEDEAFIHWQDLAGQLGADPGSEIDDFFAGTVSLSSGDLDDSDLPETLPTASTQAEPQTKQDVESLMKPDNYDASSSAESETPKSVSIDSDSDREIQPSEMDLEIGWGVGSASSGSKSQESAGEPVTHSAKSSKPTENARTKKKPSRRSAQDAKQEKNSASATTSASPTTDSDDGHWSSLATSLGLEDDPVADPFPAAAMASPTDSDKAAELEFDNEIDDPDDAEADIPTAILVEDPDEDEVFIPAKVAPSSGFGAGLLDFDEMEKPAAEVAQENILGEMFSQPAGFNGIDSDSAPQEVDSEPHLERSFEGDDEYVEFEVEELTSAGTGRRKRRPKRRGKPVSRHDDDCIEDDADQENEEYAENEADDEFHESARSGRTRRSGRSERGGRRARKKTSDRGAREAIEGNDSDTEIDSDQPRTSSRRNDNDDEDVTSDDRPKRRRRRRSRSARAETETAHEDSQVDAVLDSDLPEESGRRSSRSRKKPSGTAKKLPTWNETINVVVEGNIGTRSRKPTRKKRPGNESRGSGEKRAEKNDGRDGNEKRSRGRRRRSNNRDQD